MALQLLTRIVRRCVEAIRSLPGVFRFPRRGFGPRTPVPEPAPSPAESEPERPPADPEPETTPPALTPEPGTAASSVEPEPESAPPPVEPESEAEPAVPPVEVEPEPATPPAESEAEPALSPVEPEPESPPSSAKPDRVPRIARSFASEGPRKPREPWRFGARRSKDRVGGAGVEADHPRPPELHCRREGLDWSIFLKVAPDLGVTGVRLGEEELLPEDGEYRLPRFRGSITLVGEDGRSKNLPLFDGREPLFFRLSGSGDSSSGRQCRRITSGSFLVIAPRTERRKGFREPDECSDREFLAHFVKATNDDTPESLGHVGRWQLGTDRTASLTGTKVFDSSDEGELYVEDAPQLKPDKGIEWARVGEERPGGWKGQNFLANEEHLSDVLAGRRGRFFLRTYEPGSIRLIDSTAFRYWPDLREIEVNGQSFQDDVVLMPHASGTNITTVRLVGQKGLLVPEILTKKHARLDKGAVVVEPTLAGDEVRLRLGDATSNVNLAVALPRVWWRLAGSEAWVDKPIKMTRMECRRPGEALEILAPSNARQLSVGFEGEYRSFRAERDPRFPHKTFCSVPLESFADHRALREETDRDCSLRVLVPDSETSPLVVLVAQPDRALDLSSTGVKAIPVRLIRRETPEVRQGTVEIKALGRIPRTGSKVAVLSHDPWVDAVDVCRGPQGSRIQAVSRELGGEDVELILWHQDPTVLARNALGPAQVTEVCQLSPRSGLIVKVPRQDVSVARGSKDQNKRLAEQLLGLPISIVGRTE